MGFGPNPQVVDEPQLPISALRTDNSKDIVLPGWIVKSTVSKSPPAANWLNMIPIFVSKTDTYDQIGVNLVTQGANGAIVRLGIYDWNNGEADGAALVQDFGTLSLRNPTGEKFIVVEFTLARGMHYLAQTFNTNGAGATLTGVVEADMIPPPGATAYNSVVGSLLSEIPTDTSGIVADNPLPDPAGGANFMENAADSIFVRFREKN